MNYFVVASHGKLAQGLKETVHFFKPDAQLEVIEQTMTDTKFADRAKTLLESHPDDNIIVFTDLYGGSVNQAFMALLQHHRFHLITGMNLALILDCMFAIEDLTGEVLKEKVSEAKNQFTYMNDVYAQMIATKELEDEDE